jgi:hypothetical protein
LLQVFDAIGAIDGSYDKELEEGSGVAEGGGLRNGLEVGTTTGKGKSLAAFFDEKDGQGIVDMLEVGPFVDPLICVRVFWEPPRKAEAVNLFWEPSVTASRPREAFKRT